MRNTILSCLLLILMTAALPAQSDPSPYALFNEDGKRTKFKKLVKAARKADVILFGESHNDAVVHWLQYNLAQHLRAAAPLSIGMEMFESDQQEVLNDYLAGKVEVKAIDSVGEGLWSNFKTDYKPVVDWAAKNDVAVVATNVPRKYARAVFRYAPELKVMTITTIEEKNPSQLSAGNRGKADFTIVVSEMLGKTY